MWKLTMILYFNALSWCDPKHKDELGKIVSNYDEVFQEPRGLLPKRDTTWDPMATLCSSS